MINLLQRVNPDQSILRLSKEQIQEPFAVLEDLCSDFSLGRLRDSFSETLDICLTEDDIFRDADKRAQLIFVYKAMEKLIEAVFVIVHQRQCAGHWVEPMYNYALFIGNNLNPTIRNIILAIWPYISPLPVVMKPTEISWR